MLDTRSSTALGVLTVLIIACILVAGLWPFNSHPPNKVSWLQDRSGIQFYGQAMVYGASPLFLQQVESRNTAVTIELLLRPDKEPSNAVPSILTLYGNDQTEHFIVGQWRSGLIIRAAAGTAERHKRTREIAVGDAFVKGSTHLITVTSAKDTTDVYVDGKRQGQFPYYSLIRDDREFSGRLVLGNSPQGRAPWNGTVLGLAIYDRALNAQEALEHALAWRQGGRRLLSTERRPIALYLFDERGGQQIQDHSGSRYHLLMPATFQPLRRIILGLPYKSQWFTRWNMIDVAINILGFVPVGFLLSAWLRLVKNLPASLVYGISILLGFSLSLAVELAQVYFPTRDSSLLDVMGNTLGTAAGILLFKYALPVHHKGK